MGVVDVVLPLVTRFSLQLLQLPSFLINITGIAFNFYESRSATYYFQALKKKVLIKAKWWVKRQSEIRCFMSLIRWFVINLLILITCECLPRQMTVVDCYQRDLSKYFVFTFSVLLHSSQPNISLCSDINLHTCEFMQLSRQPLVWEQRNP